MFYLELNCFYCYCFMTKIDVLTNYFELACRDKWLIDLLYRFDCRK